MKKRKLFTLALLGAAVIFTSSCSDDEDPEPLGPSLSVTETQNASTGGDIETAPNTALIFAIEARKGENDLDKFDILQNGINLTSPLPVSYNEKVYPYSFPNADDNTYVDTIAFNSGNNIGTTSYTFSVTDDFGKTKSVTFDVSVASATTDLSSPADFTWTRVAGADGIGLDQFGLKWESNVGGSAIVKTDQATKLVSLASTAWDSFTTREELGAAIVAGTDMTDGYTNVSTAAGDDYDDVLGVRFDGNDYLLHITNSTVVLNTAGTTITITGKYKF